MPVLAWLVAHGHYTPGRSFGPATTNEAIIRLSALGTVADAMAASSEGNHTAVLDWWRTTTMDLSLAQVAVYGAPSVVLFASTTAGHLTVLQWWRLHLPAAQSNRLSAAFYGQAIARSRHSDTLARWFHEFAHDTDIMRRPMTWDRADQVAFAMTAPMDLLVSEMETTGTAVRMGHDDRIWIEGFALAGRTDALDWYYSARQVPLHTLKRIADGPELWKCPIATLDWFWAKLQRQVIPFLALQAAYAGRIDVLEWVIVEHKMPIPPFRASTRSQTEIFENGHLEVLQWLKAHGATIKINKETLLLPAGAGTWLCLTGSWPSTWPLKRSCHVARPRSASQQTTAALQVWNFGRASTRGTLSRCRSCTTRALWTAPARAMRTCCSSGECHADTDTTVTRFYSRMQRSRTRPTMLPRTRSSGGVPVGCRSSTRPTCSMTPGSRATCLRWRCGVASVANQSHPNAARDPPGPSSAGARPRDRTSE
ncbi:hypothetical protein BC828DRAFT_286114 [Blastocladiella britannica]|nr:hypothetical protein BC828DRAFT_286114 [Blastocladiella britannica]